MCLRSEATPSGQEKFCCHSTLSVSTCCLSGCASSIGTLASSSSIESGGVQDGVVVGMHSETSPSGTGQFCCT